MSNKNGINILDLLKRAHAELSDPGIAERRIKVKLAMGIAPLIAAIYEGLRIAIEEQPPFPGKEQIVAALEMTRDRTRAELEQMARDLEAIDAQSEEP